MLSTSHLHKGIYTPDIEAALAYAVQFIRNLARQWQDMEIKQKQRLQKLVLPEGIGYDKAAGEFRTAILSPIFELNQRFDADDSGLVAEAGFEPAPLGYAYYYDFHRFVIR